MTLSLPTFFRRNEVILTHDDLVDETRPMTELEHFASKTRDMIAGLDDKIEALDAEISMKIAQLGDLRRIHSAQCLALRHMEGDI